MNKREYFLRAINADAYKRKHWRFSVFSKIQSSTETVESYPYQLLVQDGVYGFNDPDGVFTVIEDASIDKPLLSFKERIQLSSGDLVNVKKDIDTTYGNVLVNAMILIYAFGDKVDFLTGKISVKQIESLIESRLESDVEPGQAEDPNRIYVHEYLRAAEAMFELSSLSPISVPSASPKTMTRDPRIEQVRAQELEANKDRLHDPAVIARIDKKLEAIDREWVDDWGRDFYIKDKAYTNARKKSFSMFGLEKGFIEGTPSVLITKSLEEGWDTTKLPAMFNSSREGSFNRGTLTMLGGVAVKEAFRATQNVKIAEEDCGSVLGVPRLITRDNAKRMIGFYHIVNRKSVEITDENVNALIGSEILLRSSMLCRTPYTDFCATCVGKTTARNPTGISALVAGVGSTFMGAFMSKMHVSSLKLAEYDFKVSIN